MNDWTPSMHLFSFSIRYMEFDFDILFPLELLWSDLVLYQIRNNQSRSTTHDLLISSIYYTIRKRGKHTSARGLILLHHSSLPFLNFISALALTSSIVGYIISLPLIAFVYVFLPFALCAFGVACFSRNCIHLSDNRAARVRSKGDGTPPWSV
jgi:hypothetical protein